MLKKLTAIILLLMFVLSAVPVLGCHDWRDAEKPVIYKSEIMVTEKGGAYNVGFAKVFFPRDFIDDSKLPVKVQIEVYAERGKAYIEFSPDIPRFKKEVTITAVTYNGLLYDKAFKKNIQTRVRSQKFKVRHFSRYAFS